MNRTGSRAPDSCKSWVGPGCCCYVCHFQSNLPFGSQPLEAVLGGRIPTQVAWG